MLRDQLQKISMQMLNAVDRVEEMRSAAELTDFFSAWQLDQLPSFQKKGNTEQVTGSGIAISTVEASHCTTDYLRTTRFIKAANAAITELLRRFPHQRLRILYAGCGPYGTLVVPLLPYLPPAQVELFFLDIHSYSLESARSLITDLALQQYTIHFIETDATAYVNKEGFHLILTETMFQALTREPQVAITEQLQSQLIPGGIFLPEEITLSAVCTHLSKEPYLNGGGTKLILPEEQSLTIPARSPLGILFSISSKTNFHKLTHGTSMQIESDYFEIPTDQQNYPDVCIFTQLRIFEAIYLHPSESLITNPHCVASLMNMSDHSHFKLIYNYRTIPSWMYKLKNKLK